MYTVRRDTSAAAATSATDGVSPRASRTMVASTIALRVRRRCAGRGAPRTETGRWGRRLTGMREQLYVSAVTALQCNLISIAYRRALFPMTTRTHTAADASVVGPGEGQA